MSYRQRGDFEATSQKVLHDVRNCPGRPPYVSTHAHKNPANRSQILWRNSDGSANTASSAQQRKRCSEIDLCAVSPTLASNGNSWRRRTSPSVQPLRRTGQWRPQNRLRNYVEPVSRSWPLHEWALPPTKITSEHPHVSVRNLAPKKACPR